MVLSWAQDFAHQSAEMKAKQDLESSDSKIPNKIIDNITNEITNTCEALGHLNYPKVFRTSL